MNARIAAGMKSPFFRNAVKEIKESFGIEKVKHYMNI